MKHHRRSHLSLTLLLPILAATLASQWGPVSEAAVDIHRITIWNDLGTGQDLEIDCRSDKSDLGMYKIPPGQNHSWSFKDPHHTQYTCDMRSGGFGGQFDVYDRERDLARCEGYCAWYVRPDGLYIHYSDGEVTKLMYTWGG